MKPIENYHLSPSQQSFFVLLFTMEVDCLILGMTFAVVLWFYSTTLHNMHTTTLLTVLVALYGDL